MTHTLDSYGGTTQLKGKKHRLVPSRGIGRAQVVHHTRGQRLFPCVAGSYLHRQQSADRAKALRWRQGCVD